MIRGNDAERVNEIINYLVDILGVCGPSTCTPKHLHTFLFSKLPYHSEHLF